MHQAASPTAESLIGVAGSARKRRERQPPRLRKQQSPGIQPVGFDSADRRCCSGCRHEQGQPRGGCGSRGRDSPEELTAKCCCAHVQENRGRFVKRAELLGRTDRAHGYRVRSVVNPVWFERVIRKAVNLVGDAGSKRSGDILVGGRAQALASCRLAARDCIVMCRVRSRCRSPRRVRAREIGERLGMSTKAVGRWRRRFHES